MKKIILLIISAALLFLNGCSQKYFFPHREELNNLEIIRIFALDKGEKDSQNKRLTVVSKKQDEGIEQSESDEENEGDNKGKKPSSSGQARIFTGEDKTVTAAAKSLQIYCDKDLFWGHADFYLIGENAARDNIEEYLDFISRDYEFRLNSLVYITEGDAAETIEKVNGTGYYMPDLLKGLSVNAGFYSQMYELRFLDLISLLEDNKTSAAAVPMLKAADKSEGNGGIQDSPVLKLHGCAIIKDYRMTGVINKEDAAAYTVISNKGGISIIQVQDKSEIYTALDVTNSHTKIIPDIKNDEIRQITIKTEIKLNIDETHSPQNIFTKDSLNYLERQAEKQLKEKIEKCVRSAQDLNADFLGIGQSIKMRAPVLWENISGNYDELFPALNIIVEVTAKINRSYDIRERGGQEEEKR